MEITILFKTANCHDFRALSFFSCESFSLPPSVLIGDTGNVEVEREKKGLYTTRPVQNTRRGRAVDLVEISLDITTGAEWT